MVNYCGRYERRTHEVICLVCEYCLPPSQRIGGRFCDQECIEISATVCDTTDGAVEVQTQEVS